MALGCTSLRIKIFVSNTSRVLRDLHHRYHLSATCAAPPIRKGTGVLAMQPEPHNAFYSRARDWHIGVCPSTYLQRHGGTVLLFPKYYPFHPQVWQGELGLSYHERSHLIMWLPWSPSNTHSNSSAEIKRPSPEELELDRAEEDIRHLSRAWGELGQLSFGSYTLLGLSALVIFSVGWAGHSKWDSIHSRHFKRIKRHYDVPDSYIREKRYLKGIVTE